MKKWAVIFLLLFCGVQLAYPQQFSEDITFVSSYLYHGKRYGGVSIQPSVKFSYDHFYVKTWFSTGTLDYHTNQEYVECDIHVGYHIQGLTCEYKFITAIDERRFVDYRYNSIGRFVLKYNFGYKYDVPITLYYSLDAFGGYDNFGYKNHNMYLEISSEKTYDHDITLYGAIGFNPKNGNITNIEGKISKTWKIDNYKCSLFCNGMINPTGISKDNLVTFDMNQKMNICLGCSFSIN